MFVRPDWLPTSLMSVSVSLRLLSGPLSFFWFLFYSSHLRSYAHHHHYIIVKCSHSNSSSYVPCPLLSVPFWCPPCIPVLRHLSPSLLSFWPWFKYALSSFLSSSSCFVRSSCFPVCSLFAVGYFGIVSWLSWRCVGR